MTNAWVVRVARGALGSVWLAASIGKALSPCSIVGLILASADCGRTPAILLAGAIVFAEGSCGCVAFRWNAVAHRDAGRMSLGLSAAILAGYTWVSIELGELANCPCFGFDWQMLPWMTLAKAGAMVGLSVWVACAREGANSPVATLAPPTTP